VRGALEQALVGTPVQNAEQPIEVLRVVHSFDPCLSCAVHVMRPGAGAPVSVLRGGGWVSRSAAQAYR
jgi:hydrogenase large subunit